MDRGWRGAAPRTRFSVVFVGFPVAVLPVEMERLFYNRNTLFGDRSYMGWSAATVLGR